MSLMIHGSGIGHEVSANEPHVSLYPLSARLQLGGSGRLAASPSPSE